MNKIIIAICASLFILSGMNSIAAPEADEFNHITETISFTQPTLSKTSENTIVQIESIETQLIKPGKPVLPNYEKTYTFPFGTEINDITCSFKDSNFMEVTDQIEYAPLPTIDGMKMESSAEDFEISKTVFPDQWYDFDVGTGLKGLERKVFVKLSIHPVRYHPETNLIEYIDDVNIDISYKSKTVNTFAAKDETFQLLILSAPEFSSAMNPLVNHKINTMNLSTKLVTTTEVYSGAYFDTEGRDYQEQIKYFIKNAIEQWDTKYVMFVGGAEYFPDRKSVV